jgi:hypothetical protein
MLIRVSRVRSGGKPLAHSTILKLRGERHHGLKPLLGVNVVAGLTGSGKTLLAEALWLGVAHALGALLGGRLYSMLALAARAYGIRPIDAKVEICLGDAEVPELRREACIEAEISEGAESWTAVPEDAAGNDELRRSLVYALLHVISVPDRVKWRAAHALRELRRAGLLKLEDGELCLAAAALAPPAFAGSPCYALEVPGVPKEGAGGEPYLDASHGEVSHALFEASYEAAVELSKLAREERGVSAVPIIYIDDAFEGLDAAKIRSLLSRDYAAASIYAATHRLEAGAYAARSLLMTYGTKASQLVEQPNDFRFALVDEELVEEDEEVFEDVSSKLVGRDA